MSIHEQKTIGVLIPVRGKSPSKHPSELPIGRAALHLKSAGIRVIFGEEAVDGHLFGMEATEEGWVPVGGTAVDAIYDRFPSQKEPLLYDRVVGRLGGVLLGNPMSLTLLCRDKLRSQRLLESVVQMPPIVDVPASFKKSLDGFGFGFLKPRYGAFGRGVRRVVPGDDLPAQGVGTLKGVVEPMLLQQGVSPPSGYAGISVRLLTSRLPGGDWHVFPGVARVSKQDPIINVHRGAVAVPAKDLLRGNTISQMNNMVLSACALLSSLPDGDLMVELGWDMMIDDNETPWMIEVNSRPRGRLEALATAGFAGFDEQHLAATVAPMAYLSWLATSTSRT
jgi:glutathione synthase/RimK-type ligase-like ATP-grasp enzyme